MLAMRTGAAFLPACPLFGFHRMGTKLSAPPLLWVRNLCYSYPALTCQFELYAPPLPCRTLYAWQEPLSAVPSAADFQKWVWAQLQVEPGLTPVPVIHSVRAASLPLPWIRWSY